MNKEEAFDFIIDPETNKKVAVDTKIGKTVIQNYITFLKEGENSTNIISTQQFYKNPTTGGKTKQKQKPKQIIENKILKGICSICNKKVFSTQKRCKNKDSYMHATCYDKQSMTQTIII